MKVIKRSGEEVEFDIKKISDAISKANNTVDEKIRMTQVQIDRIADNVRLACENLGRAPAVEEIQDMVWMALSLLGVTSAGRRPDLGKKGLVVGGGNTAMDAARTAQRLAGVPVTVVYRRTRAEMPAIEEERALLFEEGNRLEELAAPLRVVIEDRKSVV